MSWWLCLLFMICQHCYVAAQSQDLRGKVTESAGGTLPGVTVMIKGTSS